MTEENIEKVLDIALQSVKTFYRKQILDYINRLKEENERLMKAHINEYELLTSEMNNGEIEKMAKIIEPFITVLCDSELIAETLSAQGIGDKKQAVKEFAKRLIDEYCYVDKDEGICMGAFPDEIRDLFTELYGVDE